MVSSIAVVWRLHPWILHFIGVLSCPLPVPYQTFGAEVEEHFYYPPPQACLKLQHWSSTGSRTAVMRDAVARGWPVKTWEHFLAGIVSAGILFILLHFFVQALSMIVLSVMFGNLFLSEERCLKRGSELYEELNLHSPLLGFFCNSQELVISSLILVSTLTPISAADTAVYFLCQ